MGAGTLSLSATGEALTTNITGLANLTSTISIKWCQKVDSLRTLGAAGVSTGNAIGFFDADGANGSHKACLGWNVSATGNLALRFKVFGGSDITGPAGSYTNLTAAGTYIICEIDCVTGTQHFNVYHADGVTQIPSMSGSTSLTFSMSSVGSPGVFTLNRDNSASLFTQYANVYGGVAIYNVVLTGGQVTSPPLPSDSGLQFGAYLNDATSGSSPTVTSNIVGAPFTITNGSWLADTSPWFVSGTPSRAVKTATFAARHRSFHY